MMPSEQHSPERELETQSQIRSNSLGSGTRLRTISA